MDQIAALLVNGVVLGTGLRGVEAFEIRRRGAGEVFGACAFVAALHLC